MEYRSKQKRKGAIFGFIVGIGLLAALGLMMATNQGEATAHGTKVAYHNHVQVEYFVNGQESALPNNIGNKGGLWTGYLEGEGPEGLAPLHTHDFTGTVHIEPTENKSYTLADLFKIWGAEPESVCLETIAGLCSPVENYADTKLMDGDKFQIKA